MFTKKILGRVFFIFGIVSALLWSQQVSAHELRESGIATVTGDPVIGLPFTISQDIIDETNPAVAYNPVDREYLVVWENIRSVENDIYAQRISEQGKLLSSFFVAKGGAPKVAYNKKNNTYLVVFQKYLTTDYDIYAQRVDFTGPFGSEFPIAFDLNHTEHSPAIAYNTHPNHDEFLVVWEEIPPPPATINRIEGQRVKGTEVTGSNPIQTIGGPLTITDSTNYNYEPDIAYNLNMNEFMVVYTRIPGGGGNYDVIGRRVTWDGILLIETSIDSSGGGQYNPAVAAYRLNSATPYLVVFSDTWNDTASDVRGYLVNKQGQPVQLISIATTSGQREYNPAIAQNEAWGGYFVTWTQGPSGDQNIFGSQVSDNGFPNPAFNISRASSLPMACNRQTSDIAVGIRTALAVWADPCGAVGGLDIVGQMLGHWLYLPLAVR